MSEGMMEHTYLVNVPVRSIRQIGYWMTFLLGSPHPIWGTGKNKEESVQDMAATVIEMCILLDGEKDNLGSAMQELHWFLQQFVTTQEIYTNTSGGTFCDGKPTITYS